MRLSTKKFLTILFTCLFFVFALAGLLVVFLVGHADKVNSLAITITEKEKLGIIIGSFLCGFAAVFFFISIILIINLLCLNKWIKRKCAILGVNSIEEFMKKYPDVDIDSLFIKGNSELRYKNVKLVNDYIKGILASEKLGHSRINNTNNSVDYNGQKQNVQYNFYTTSAPDDIKETIEVLKKAASPEVNNTINR